MSEIGTQPFAATHEALVAISLIRQPGRITIKVFASGEFVRPLETSERLSASANAA